MDSKSYNVGGRSFGNEADYQAALRDRQKIQVVEKKYEMSDDEGRERLLELLRRGGLNFETVLGNDFIGKMEDRYQEMMSSLSESDGAASDTKLISLRKKEIDQQENRKKKLEKKALKKKEARVKKAKAKEAQRKKQAAKKAARMAKVKTKIKAKTESPKRLEDYDADMQIQIRDIMLKQEKKRKRMVAVCSLIAMFCMGYVFFYYYQYAKNSAQYEHLASLKDEGEETDDFRINYTNEEKKELVVIDKYKKLYSQNKSLIGWLKIDDTNIDYPVMQTVNNEYYLDHNYTQEYDKNGSIFLDKDCDITNPGTNLIIYGHHMKSGKMFGKLDLYSSRDYYEEHKYIQFDTIYEEGTYEVMYVFRSRVYNEDDIVFKYYQFFEAATPEEFDSNMNEMAKISLYDTGVTATFGDKLITLSTCDHAEEDGRFVVVAKKVS